MDNTSQNPTSQSNLLPPGGDDPGQTPDPEKEKSKKKSAPKPTYRQELNKVVIAGFLVSNAGSTRLGDVLYRIMELLSKTGYTVDESTGMAEKELNRPIAEALIQFLESPVKGKQAIQSQGAHIGPDMVHPDHLGKVCDRIMVGGGEMCITPLAPNPGERQPTISLQSGPADQRVSAT